MPFDSRGAVTALQAFIAAVLLLVGFQILVLVPAAVLSKVGVVSGALAYVASGVLAIVALVCAVLAIRRAPRWLAEFADDSSVRLGAVLLAIGIGVSLRVLLIAISNVAPQSDAKVYTEMAAMLADGKPFYYVGRWAYWPIGYPLLLSGWFRIGGDSLFGIHLLNVLLYVAMSLGVWRLCKAIGKPAVGRLAVWLLALWPDLIALSAWPSKELVAMTLLPWCVALAIVPQASMGRALWYRLGAGIAGGMLVLVQPSFILLVPVIPVIAWLANTQTPRQAVVSWLVLIVAASATIAPWTVRNYRVLGAFVPVATNGGEVMYRANNPLATGEYIKVGEVDLWKLPELEANREGARLAKEWIVAHPGEFLALALKKQAFLLEDDAIGVYETFNRGHVGEPVPGVVYFMLKAACNAYWWLLWVALGASLIIAMRGAAPGSLAAIALSLPFLYLYGVHSIAESGPRYHQPADPFVAVCVAAFLGVALARRRTDPHA